MERWLAKLLCGVILTLACLFSSFLALFIAKRYGQIPSSKGCGVFGYIHGIVGGIFLGTLTLHLIPEVRSLLSVSLLTEPNMYPVPEVLLASSFVGILLLEQCIALLLVNRGDVNGSLFKNTTGKTDCAEETDIIEADLITETKPIGVDSEEKKTEYGSIAEDSTKSQADQGNPRDKTKSAYSSSNSPTAGETERYARPFILIFATSVHGVFEGMAIGLQRRTAAVWSVFFAISVHKCLMAFSLIIQLSVYKNIYPKIIFVGLVKFVLSAVVGLAIGTVLMETYVTNKQEEREFATVNGILQGIATGTFLYITAVEILTKEIDAGNPNPVKVFFVAIGLGIMAGLRVIML